MARFGFGWFSLDRGRTHPMGDLGAARGSTVYIPPPSKKSEIHVESVIEIFTFFGLHLRCNPLFTKKRPVTWKGNRPSEYFFSKTKRVFLYI